MNLEAESILEDYLERYYPVSTFELLETIMYNFEEDISFLSPFDKLEYVEALENTLSINL